MTNPLLAFWHRLFVVHPEPEPLASHQLDLAADTQASSTIFLILRRMRTPLVVLIVIFAVCVLGLTLIPGRLPDGTPWRMTFFDALYFMSYTAATIGFGEVPNTFSTAQRMWVTLSIYLAVIGWAYTVGYLLALMQDRGFRQAIATQRFRRQVAHLRDPFVLMAGYGRTGTLVGRSLDANGRRFTVVDVVPDRIEALDLESFHSDVPGLAADAGKPVHLVIGGLDNPGCQGVLALTNDDRANLAVVMTTAMLRPDVPVIARTASSATARRMRAFGNPLVVNPYDDFGDQLRVALQAPATYQLTQWLTSPPGTDLPPRREPPPRGRWVVAGGGRFGREVTADLQADGLRVALVEVAGPSEGVADLDRLLGAPASDAVGFVAGTDDDLTNIAAIEAVRRANQDLFVVARQGDPANETLFRAMGVDLLLVASEVIAHEVIAHLTSPGMSEFVRALPGLADDQAQALLDQLVGRCGREVPARWQVRLTAADAPAILPWLQDGLVLLADLLRSPDDRSRSLAVVPLALVRAGQQVLLPAGAERLQPDDALLLAGAPVARRALGATLGDEATGAYIVTGREPPTTWLGRRLAGRSAEDRDYSRNRAL